MKGAILFVEPGGCVGLHELVEAEYVIGVMPDGVGRVIKDRHWHTETLSRECVEWLKANPMNRPEDFTP